MSDKQYSPEEVLNLQSAAYQKGYYEGYQLGRYEEAQQCAVWVKGAPADYKQYFAKVPSVIEDGTVYDAVIWPIEGSEHWWCVGYGFKFSVHRDKIIAHINEQATTSNKEDAHEKEIMMQAFCKVQQLFEGREWIMQGRGSYPYNDDRYKEEVRFLYDEFEAVRKDTWDNIKSKSVDYRKWIIDKYLKDNPSNKDEAVEFAEWVRDNTVPDGAPKLFYKPDISRYTIRQLYDLWQQSKNKP